MKILVSGWYGNGNIGDESILDAILYDIRAISPESEVTVLSSDPAWSVKYHRNIKALHHAPLGFPEWGSRLFKQGPKGLAETMKGFRSCDIFLLGGGGFVSDWQKGALKRWLRQLYWAKKGGAATMVYAVGVGPVSTSEGKKTIRRFMEYADVIAVRDKPSAEILSSTGVSDHFIYTTSDPVLNGYLAPKRTACNNRVLAVLHPVFHIRRLWPNMREKYDKFKRGMVEWLSKTVQFHQVDLLPFMSKDKSFLEDLVDLLPVEAKAKVNIIQTPGTPEEAIDVISGYSVVISMRYHGLILSLLSGKPTIGIVTHHKHYALLKGVGLHEKAECLGDGKLWPESDVDPGRLFDNTMAAMRSPNEFSPGKNAMNALKKGADQNRLLLKALYKKRGKSVKG